LEDSKKRPKAKALDSKKRPKAKALDSKKGIALAFFFWGFIRKKIVKKPSRFPKP
jgi:hypothetical protein